MTFVETTLGELYLEGNINPSYRNETLPPGRRMDNPKPSPDPQHIPRHASPPGPRHHEPPPPHGQLALPAPHPPSTGPSEALKPPHPDLTPAPASAAAPAINQTNNIRNDGLFVGWNLNKG
ncbi:hypothetical protein EUGRSUZ_C00441 [Eucalyptus grandis]|uniref:Uncharacterized protein n=2 Tax=Eucalyptus grandis TaxID=71139 RepID=A0ACC3LBU1_EUCGR|nr:hypothetical protein EUGRSUZ_C00441 [Eucalyptus grandis]